MSGENNMQWYRGTSGCLHSAVSTCCMQVNEFGSKLSMSSLESLDSMKRQMLARFAKTRKALRTKEVVQVSETPPSVPCFHPCFDGFVRT